MNSLNLKYLHFSRERKNPHQTVHKHTKSQRWWCKSQSTGKLHRALDYKNRMSDRDFHFLQSHPEQPKQYVTCFTSKRQRHPNPVPQTLLFIVLETFHSQRQSGVVLSVTKVNAMSTQLSDKQKH